MLPLGLAGSRTSEPFLEVGGVAKEATELLRERAGDGMKEEEGDEESSLGAEPAVTPS